MNTSSHTTKKKSGLCAQSGMTYVEIIVVLSIFSALTSVVIFNYGDFQARVDIKNLASDVALKIAEAQKSSLSGLLPPPAQQGSVIPGWKPSYGVYFTASPNDSFIYFTDLNNNTAFDSSDCTGECLTKTTITKNNYISRLDVFYQSAPLVPVSVPNFTVTFARPDSGAVITSVPALGSNISYIQITVSSPKGVTSPIKLYPSGRIQVN